MNRSFTISSDEGLPIRGDLHVPTNPRGIVVVIHGFKGFKDWGMFPWLAETLCNAGFAVCRFEMSRNGVGERPREFDRLDLFADDTYSIARADLLSVIEFVRGKLPGLRISLVGHSRGGGVALLAAGEIPDLRSIITWSSIATTQRWDPPTLKRWRADGFLDVRNARTGQNMRMSTAVLADLAAHDHDILGAASRLPVPLLVLHGMSDESVPSAEGRLLEKHGRDSSLVLIGRGTHTFGASHPFTTPTNELLLAAKLTLQFLL